MPYGVEHLTDSQLDQVIGMYEDKIPRFETDEDYVRFEKMSDDAINTKIENFRANLETRREQADTLRAQIKALLKKWKETSDPTYLKEAKRKKRILDFKVLRIIDALEMLIDRCEGVLFCRVKIPHLNAKYQACVEERDARIAGLKEGPKHGSNRFVDRTKQTGTLTGTVTFTNASATVTGSGTAFTTELSVGDYIKPSTSGYNEWYRVNSIESDTSLTLSWNFAQATVTDPANSTPYNSEDGSAAANAFCHLRQATTDEVRAAGDVIYCRRGQTHLYAGVDIAFDEDGTANNYITLMGDDGTGWVGETGLDKPIIGFGDAEFQMYLHGDDYWKIKDMEIIESDDSKGGLQCENIDGLELEDLDIHDNDPGKDGLWLSSVVRGLIKNCTFYNNLDHNTLVARTRAKFVGCKWNGGVVTTDIGLYIRLISFIELENCEFGVTTAHDNFDVSFHSDAKGSRIIGRNVKLGSPNEVATPKQDISIKIEDYDQTKLANKAWFWNGNINRVTDPVRVGGASSSAEMVPNSNCGSEQPLELCQFTEELSRWLSAGSRKCEIYLRGNGWTTFPTASELYIEVLYFDGATSKRASIKSTEVLTANDTWTKFDVEFTLNSNSPCYANVVLKKYESGAKIFVDILPVWS